jgi:hypothetical protein
VRQVKNTINCNSPHLRNYQQELHRLINKFQAFNITFIPLSKNILVDSLATIAPRLYPLKDYDSSRIFIDLLYKPYVPDNITNWRVFEGDEKIISFLNSEENFKDLDINDEVFKKMFFEKEDGGHNTGKNNNMSQPNLHTMPM